MPKAALIREYLAQHVELGTTNGGDPAARLIGIYEGSEEEHGAVDAALYGG